MNLNLKALVISWALTVVIVGASLTGAGVLLGNKRVRDYKRGWNLTAVVVAARDLPIGTKLAAGDLAIREVPEQFTASALKEPELALAIGHRLELPLLRDDVLAPWMYTQRRLGPSCQHFAEETAKVTKLDQSEDVNQLLNELAQAIAHGK